MSRISNLTLEAQENSIDYFLFCTTSTFDKNSLKDFGYDACVVIHEPVKFFYSISEYIIDLAEYVGLFPCDYTHRKLSPQVYNRKHPALIKDPKYANQREVRAIWKPRKYPIEHMVIECPKATEYCSTRV